ncbi:response regulator [Almyronema epifaneia]|uniref:histidine kinase n=1 Tax=Almyronema epifaneia S1 TaxID=2991925 RepID=A0ABW6IIK3_9CYAN
MVIPQSGSAKAAAKAKILVVDDETDNLDLLYRTFFRNFQVLRASSGAEALEILAAQPEVAVIISDQRMPGMSGTELLSQVAAQYPNIIRIMLTGYTDVEDLVEAINAGKVFKYVTKPWDEDDLKAIVQQAVETHSILEARTADLARVLRQETLLNAVTNTIRSAQSSRQMLQTIVNTVGPIIEVDWCILLTFDVTRDSPYFVYSSPAQFAKTKPSDFNRLQHTIWQTQTVQQINRSDLLWVGSETIDASVSQTYDALDIQSSLLIPLIFKQNLVAVLALHQCGQVRSWSSDEVQLLVTMADQAALAVAQMTTYEQIQSLAQREVLINTITQAIRSSLDPKEIFAAITQKLCLALKTNNCALSLWFAEAGYVRCVSRYRALDQELVAVPPFAISDLEVELEGLADASSEAEVMTAPIAIADDPILQQLAATQRPVVIDATAPPTASPPQMLGDAGAECAMLAVPLLAEGQIIGSIYLEQPGFRVWRQDEIDLAQAVAAQAAIAVQQARLYQKTRQQAESLLELDRLKTEFFQNISHEFRTPLTLAIGPLETAIAQEQGLSYEQSQVMLRNARRLLRLVNQLLDLQRLDAGRMQPTFRPCDPVPFISKVIEAFRPYCDRKDLQLVVELPPTCSTLYLDLEKFDKVVYNLLSNAMKFTPTGGRITVSLKTEAEQVCLQVQDTGIGILAEQLPYLFERFRQADGSASRHSEGTGLGLAIAKELVDLHGGDITVSSQYGQGTTFTVWLPLGKAHLPSQHITETRADFIPQRATVELADIEGLQTSEDLICDLAATEAAKAVRGQPQILVVDDHPDLRAYVTSILRQAGYGVQAVANGEIGLAVMRRQPPSLVVTDLMMPGISGLELIRQVRADEALQGIPIVLLTAKADDATRITGTEEGADAYLSKPFSDRELLAEVRNLLALKANERRVAELNTYLTESVLKRFLPPALVQKAAQGNLQLDLQPEPRLVTILFSDIIGFTQLSTRLQAKRIAEVLNEYLAAMSQAIFDNGGTVDKFMGDAVLALFGAPEDLSSEQQAQQAIAAAQQMYRNLHQLNQRWQAQGVGTIQFRCGIHQGRAVVGMFGSAERTDYTAIGPSVNIAARLQEAAEADCILVSESVARFLPEADTRQIGLLQLRGIDKAVLTFGVKVNSQAESSTLLSH